MPELPEVEVLVRHLAPLIRGRTIQDVHVQRAKVLGSTQPDLLKRTLRGARFVDLARRGKYLLFTIRCALRAKRRMIVGHLGMSGRMYLLPSRALLPKHAAVVLGLGRQNLVFEDTRYFGRFTLDTSALAALGPEPLDSNFTPERLAAALKRSAQPVKVKLLDQKAVVGLGNIYASEALFRARISPRLAACRLNRAEIKRLWRAIRETLAEAIDCGSTVPLDYAGAVGRDRLFYFGRAEGAPDYYEERLRVYDREGKRCLRCGGAIRRLVQAGRSTFYCPRCQSG